MKLIRVGPYGFEVPAVEIEGKRYDVSDWFKDFDEVFFESGGIEQLQEFLLEKQDELPVILNDIRLGSPVARPSKIICVGLNYVDHASEMKTFPPVEPVIFLKATTALSGPCDDIIIPKNSVKTDWEVELSVVMAKKASYVTEEEAMDYVAGYCLHNDVSERAFQLERNGTWDKGKGCDTFAPLGPWLVTKDEVPDVHDLRLWLTVNGEMMQNGNTNNLIFKIPFLVAYISQFMTLLPGDVISTGTPAGVGLGMNPPVYLKDGDVVELGIDGLGTSKQMVVEYNAQQL